MVFTCECSCQCGICDDEDCDCECHDIPSAAKAHDLEMFCVMKKLVPALEGRTKNELFDVMSKSDDPEKTLKSATRIVKNMMKTNKPDKPQKTIVKKGYTRKGSSSSSCNDDV